MQTNNENYPPVNYIKNLSDQNHLLVLYDNIKYGQIVQNQFVIEGLKKDEKCVVLTHTNPKSIEKVMLEGGIDVDYYKKKNLLHVIPIEEIITDPEGILSAFNKLYKKISIDSTHPCRFVGRLISDICTREGIKTELELEKLFHEKFNSYDCSFMCTYGIEDIEKENRSSWIKELANQHHKIVYATVPESAVGFDSDLLNTVDE
jgi:spore coat polysaccharide biosynthesis predicted glycosyltransferase SpsG